MDRKSVIVIVVCFALMGLWSLVLVPKLYPPKPLPPGATNFVAQSSTSTATQTVATPPSAPPNLSPATAPRPAFASNTVEQTLVLTNENARYTFTSHGGGLKSVDLVRYPETVSRRRR